jgi:predicted alpha/beta hydrolase family esterase
MSEKRAVILHGTSAQPMSGWRPWLKEKFEADGYEVWLPELPENDTPNREIYGNFLFGQGWDFTDNIVVGHSSGAVEVLNLLDDERCPRIKLGVCVAAWKGGLPKGYDEVTNPFKKFFPEKGFNFSGMKAKAGHIAFMHSDNDPYCPPQDAEYLADKLSAELQMFHTEYGSNADHFGSPLTELPELWTIIQPYL